MKSLPDLELTLHRRDSGYAVEVRFTPPDSDADVRLAPGAATTQLDFERLRAHTLDQATYGLLLTSQLFADPTAREAFLQARATAHSLDLPLRLRLFIAPGAGELHALRWETLRDPHDDTPLLMGERVLFSRYLSSSDWRPIRLRPKGDLRALIAIANPSDLASYQPEGQPLAPIDVAGELERARAGLAGIAVTDLGATGRVTLARLFEQLREGYDILYLVAHGALIEGQPWLWLEDDAGASAQVAGSDLATRIQDLGQRPRLVALISCQSAGTGQPAQGAGTNTLAALGPRLAEAGVPAVLAMQGSISMQTVAQFVPVFFHELQRDGQIDRALAVARGAVRDRPDAWMPALFMRLRSGRIWYVPGFGDDQKNFQKWPALIRSILDGRCTPILGFGLVEPLLGPSREIAQRWADTYHFPMAPYAREDLPQVAQYLAVNQDEQFVRGELAETLRQELLRRFGDELPPEQHTAPLHDLIDAVGARQRERDPAEPHRVLAGLPFPLYITTNPDGLLEAALAAAGKTPTVALCPWNDYVDRSYAVYEGEPGASQPLVYHLFGRLQEPDSLVLTEDDYFNYLIGVTSNNRLHRPRRRDDRVGCLRPEPYRSRGKRGAGAGARKGRYGSGSGLDRDLALGYCARPDAPDLRAPRHPGCLQFRWGNAGDRRGRRIDPAV